MKQFIITIFLVLIAVSGHGQKLKSSEATFNDYIPLLNAISSGVFDSE